MLFYYTFIINTDSGYCNSSSVFQKQYYLSVLLFFRGKYYRMSSESDLSAFLMSPELFVPPNALKSLPPPELLPQRLSHADVKERFPQQLEIQGICPVSYVDGQRRYANHTIFVNYTCNYYRHIKHSWGLLC